MISRLYKLSSKESVCQGFVYLLTSNSIAFSIKPKKNYTNIDKLCALLSPPAIVGTVVNPSNTLPPADGAADISEHGDGEPVPGLEPVRDTLGL